MEFRVSVNGTILKNNPKGLDSFSKEFTLDSEIFGVYSVSSFDLVFVGDGYCIIKDIFDSNNSCEILIKIEQYCNKSWKTIFDGISEVGSIKIDESISEANIEIQDNSPLVLISRNSDVTIDLETDKDIFDNTITPATFANFIYGTGRNNGAYTGYGVYWNDALRLVTEAITGVSVNVTSSYMQTTPQPCIYTLQYTGDLADILDSIIVFKNFQGVTQTITANVNTGNLHLQEVSKRLLSTTLYLNDNQGIAQTMQFNDDYRNFFKTEINVSTKTITCYSNLPIEIISATANSIGSPITLTVTKVQDFIDGGNNPVFFNYRSIKNQPSPYLFTMSFKQIMETLNKEYNIYFTAKYNNAGAIDLIVEDSNYFFNIQPNVIIENPKQLNMEYSDTSAFSSITLGDNSNTTLANRNYTLTTNFCAIKNAYNSRSDVNIGSVKIWEDLAASFEDGLEDVVYMMDNDASMYYMEWSDNTYINPISKSIGYVYNLYLTNWHKIYRHFYKFKGNIIGVVPYVDVDTNNYNINIVNTAPRRFYRSVTFKTIMSDLEFSKLTDNIVDFCKVKTQNGDYQEGLISSVSYNYNTAEAEFTILGENKYVN